MPRIFTHLLGFTAIQLFACGQHEPPLLFADDPSLDIVSVQATYRADVDALVFEVTTAGNAGSVVPPAAGQLDGAPVLGYVFVTTFAPSDIGFARIDGTEPAGTVALAVTSHPDFDDTPLWDESGNDRFDDDGAVYHAHWVLLNSNDRAPAGLAVVQNDDPSSLPPTAPMPMYLDSPGFTVVEDGPALRVVIPADRVSRNFDVRVSGLVAYMEVDASRDTPLLAVHEILSQLGDGTPTIALSGAESAPDASWPLATPSLPVGIQPSFDIQAASAQYISQLDAFLMTMDLEGDAATVSPTAEGQVDGAPVLGYVFPTNIPPAAVGFDHANGILALAVTSHPDFDDTPLWDENGDGDYANDGIIYHVHWAVLAEDSESGAGLSAPAETDSSKLPPTAPMALYLDSPGFHAFARGGRIHVVVPAWHLRGIEDFAFDAVTALMRVDASGAAPVLRVEELYEVLSGDLSLPFTAER